MLQATTLDINQALPAIPPLYRITPVIVGIRSRRKVLVAKSWHGSWHLPQGEMEKGETILDAVPRELREELGIGREDIYMQSAKVLGIAVNRIPHERKVRDGDPREKVLVFVAVPIAGAATIVLNNENTQWTSVGDPYHLWTLMRGARDVKFSATCEALRMACSLGMLFWKWDDSLPMRLSA